MKSRINFSLALLLLVNLNFGQNESWMLNADQSFISYDAKHVLHAWKGINSNVKGVAKIEMKGDQIKEIAILTLVKDFDSNNTGRDAHALEVLESLSFPEVRFYADTFEITKDSVQISGLFNFHGVDQKKSITAHLENLKNKKILTGKFNLIPSDFDIALPSFMMVKMENLLTFDFKLEFSK
ncbi:YceI family protein [Flavobacteriaceae bacterium]|nr:YceI family protein [Flavobacteriaceae bacterium]